MHIEKGISWKDWQTNQLFRIPRRFHILSENSHKDYFPKEDKYLRKPIVSNPIRQKDQSDCVLRISQMSVMTQGPCL